MRYNDYASMQSSAQRRVSEMQRRAREAAYGAPQERPTAPPEPEQHTARKKPGLQPMLDSERLLIATLLLIIASEKADWQLAAALLYIMSGEDKNGATGK